MSMFSQHYVIGRRTDSGIEYWDGKAVDSFTTRPLDAIRIYSQGDAEKLVRGLLKGTPGLHIFQDE